MNEAIQKQKDKAGIMRYQGQDYAVGLLWLTSENEDEEQRSIRAKAKALEADFYVPRDTIVHQNGFGYLDQGHRRRLPAAASTAADVLVGEWHGVFVADNGWWYVAVHADAIAPDGDMFFEDEEAAYNHFVQRAENYRWPKAFVPESWNLEDSTAEMPLSKIFDDIPDATLQPANLDALFGGRRNKDIAVVLASVLVGIVMLTTLASQILPSLLPSPREVNSVQVATSNVLTAPPKPSVGQDINPLLRFGDFSLPTPSLVISACIKAMELAPGSQWPSCPGYTTWFFIT